MKKMYFFLVSMFLLVVSAIMTGCPNSSSNPSSPNNPYLSTATFTPTPVPSGPTATPTLTPTSTPSATITNTPSASITPTTTPSSQTIDVSAGSGGASYIYRSTSGSNNGSYVLILTAHVGDTINLPGSSLHPLYFDAGTNTCIYSNAQSNQSYTFTATGTYYFHCGNHASGCSMGNGACGSTNCVNMAGVVTVN